MGVRIATVEDVNSMSLIHTQTWKIAYIKYISEEYLNNITDEGWIPLFTRAFIKNFHEAAVFEIDGKITGTVSFGRGRPMISCTTSNMSKSDKSSSGITEDMNKHENSSSYHKTYISKIESSCCDTDFSSEGEIISLYVLPQYWSTKQGYYLTKFSIDRLKNQGYKSCYLWVIKQNERAVNFYKRFGFKSTGELKTVMLAGQAVVEEKYRIYFSSRQN